MLMLVSLLIVGVMLVCLLKVVAFLISESFSMSREEVSCYECGFEHNNLSRVPFSLRYFYLTLIFLLFDLEVALMLFIAYMSFASFLYSGVVILVVFLLVLLVGLIYEWLDGALDWLK